MLNYDLHVGEDFGNLNFFPVLFEKIPFGCFFGIKINFNVNVDF